MRASSASDTGIRHPFAQLRLAKEIIQVETRALTSLANSLDENFCRAIELILSCQGSIVVTGMGKAGLIGQKIAATLASTGSRSNFLHPSEAMHGDLGRIHVDDVILFLSNSGETEEIVRLLPSLAHLEVPMIAISGRRDSTLARRADVTLVLGVVKEACGLGLAPSTSTTAMLALGDALALVTSEIRGFTAEDFARYHPGGSLGLKLSRVEDVMRPLEQCRVAHDGKTVRELFVEASRPGRRTGAIVLVNDRGEVSGIFTDSDLARLFENKHDSALDQPIDRVMTRSPERVPQGMMLVDAVHIMTEKKISELPVVDRGSRPIGIIDITDVVGLLPTPSLAADRSSSRARSHGHGETKPRETIPIRLSR